MRRGAGWRKIFLALGMVRRILSGGVILKKGAGWRKLLLAIGIVPTILFGGEISRGAYFILVEGVL